MFGSPQPDMTPDAAPDVASEGARHRQRSWTAPLAAAALILLLFAISIVILWRDFSGQWGMVAQDMAPAVVPLRPLLLLQLALIAALVAYLLTRVWGDAVPAIQYSPRLRWTLVGLGVLLSVMALCALRAFPNSGDEYNYLFEADTFLRGRIWNPLLPGQDLMYFNWILAKDGKWVSQFPPGWPLLLAGAHMLGVRFAALNPLLGGALLLVLVRFCRQQEDDGAAMIALALVAVSAFFAFNAGSYFDHIPSALFGLLFCMWGAQFVARPSLATALLTGGALGAVGLTRPFDGVFFVLPFAVTCLIHGRAAHYRYAMAIALGGLPFLAALMVDYRAITGDALLSPYMWGFPGLKLGWPSYNEMGYPIGAGDEMRMLYARLVMLAEWTSPLLALLYVPALVWRLRSRRLRFYDLIFPLNAAAYLLFPSYGGNQYGPRYFFDSFPLAAVTLAAAAAALLANRARPRIAGFTAALGAAHLTISFAAFVLLLGMMRGVVDGRMDLFDQADAMGLHHAVVIVRSPTGVTSPMMPMDLTRNGLTRNGNVIYALDVPALLPDLRRLFPGRSFYVYERALYQPHGKITALSDTPAR